MKLSHVLVAIVLGLLSRSDRSSCGRRGKGKVEFGGNFVERVLACRQPELVPKKSGLGWPIVGVWRERRLFNELLNERAQHGAGVICVGWDVSGSRALKRCRFGSGDGALVTPRATYSG